jgi:hypothetical protein
MPNWSREHRADGEALVRDMIAVVEEDHDACKHVDASYPAQHQHRVVIAALHYAWERMQAAPGSDGRRSPASVRLSDTLALWMKLRQAEDAARAGRSGGDAG